MRHDDGEETRGGRPAWLAGFVTTLAVLAAVVLTSDRDPPNQDVRDLTTLQAVIGALALALAAYGWRHFTDTLAGVSRLGGRVVLYGLAATSVILTVQAVITAIP